MPGSEFVIPCDMVIPAIGQKVDTGCLDKEGAPGVSKWGTLAADADTLVTDQPGIFAGGDFVSGPATLIEAMAAGFRVSRSIDQYFREGRVSLSEDERMSRVFGPCRRWKKRTPTAWAAPIASTCPCVPCPSASRISTRSKAASRPRTRCWRRIGVCGVIGFFWSRGLVTSNQ